VTLGVVHACVDNETGSTRIILPFSKNLSPTCEKGETTVHWGTRATRFLDLGKTVVDMGTGLEWEKKTTTVGSGINITDLHDVDNTYDWFSATGSWIAALNVEGKAGFAGHNDWRLPSVGELVTIFLAAVGFSCTNAPCIDPIFGATSSNQYWTATEGPVSLTNAEAINVGADEVPGDDHLFSNPKPTPLFVRAVRTNPYATGP
jgi:hypothetical protein